MPCRLELPAIGARICHSEVPMAQRFLTDDEFRVAKALVGWKFWFAPVLFGLASMASGWAAATGEVMGLVLLGLFGGPAIVLWVLRLRQHSRFTADIEHRTVEVLEGAPQRVWMGGRTGDCYLRISGQTIKVPNEFYAPLTDATMVKVAFLPTSKMAVRVDTSRGISIA